MRANASALQKKRDRYRGGGGNRSAKRARIRAEMSRLQCGKKTRVAKARTKNRKTTKKQPNKSKTILGLRTRQARNEPRKNFIDSLFSTNSAARTEANKTPRREQQRRRAARAEQKLRSIKEERRRLALFESRQRERGQRFARFDQSASRQRDDRRRVRRPRVRIITPPQSNGRTRARTGSGYRTLCVRTCDGYYWPISFSTGRGQFSEDEQVCQAMCPSADVALFVHSNPGQESEDMTSFRTGAAYDDLPNAYLYRSKISEQCSCRARSRALTEASGQLSTGTEALTDLNLRASINPPPGRPEPTEDPDTVFNLAGSYNPAKPPVSKDTGDKPIRIVGPTYFYVQ